MIEDGEKAYEEDYGTDSLKFMQWLNGQTVVDEVIVLFWW